jgi:hypothetical protein
MHAPDTISNGQVQLSSKENEDSLTCSADDLEEKVPSDQETDTRVTTSADRRDESFSSVALSIPGSATNHQGIPLRGTYSTYEI